MRPVFYILPLLISSFTHAQTMTEIGASAAGSAVGSAAGKKVSEGITAIFGKVDKTASKAAKPHEEDSSKDAPLLEVGPGIPKVTGNGIGGESVPPPPPMHRASAAKAVAPEPMPEILPPPPPPPPPPPQVTADDLKKIASGTSRDNLLRLGAPASRIMMSDDGHILETFSYASKDTAFGRVKLTDGTVSSIEVW